jgi:hypothetical protein
MRLLLKFPLVPLLIFEKAGFSVFKQVLLFT